MRIRPMHPAALLVLLAAQASPATAQEPAVRTVAFEAPSVGRTMKYNVVLPEGYDDSTAKYPVLYLLHGLTSNYTAWARMGVPRYARRYNLIVVMPDAGNSWYVNWSESEGDQKNAWEDCIVKDLVGHVDATYRTVARREGRAINGLSMGGYGALMLGLRHPELFASIGSHSGALAFARGVGLRLRDGMDISFRRQQSRQPNPEIGIEGFSSQDERTPRGRIFTTAEECDAYDPFELVREVPREKLPHIYLDCGTEDRLLESNQEFARLLMERKLPFTYAQSAGGHRPDYWTREVEHSMAVQSVILRRALGQEARDRPEERSRREDAP
ncbi:MAG TPA: alpha/beta hydrolase family protein [Isosphaeraceae bacterium]